MKIHIISHLIRRILLFTCLFPTILLVGPANAETMALCNFDATNSTGQCANDFEIFLGGVETNDITWLYTEIKDENGLNGFPNVTKTEVPGGTLVTWTGNTNCGTSSHFGVTLANGVVPTSTNLSGTLYTWTYNSVPIGNIPGVWQTLILTSGSFQVVVNNPLLNEPIFVQRRINFSTNNLALNDLMPDMPIYTNAAIIDPSPVIIPPGGALTNFYIVNTNYAAYAPIVNVFVNNNGLPGNFAIGLINAMNVTNNQFSGPIEINTMGNYTVTNNTGQVANDFETFIGGITNLNEITGYWTNTSDFLYPGYPTVTAQLVPGGAVITWTGSQTLPGHYSHFGVRGVQPIPQMMPAVKCTWTSNSIAIGDSPVTWPIIRPGGAGFLQAVIGNPFPFNIWIQRWTNALAVPPNLEALTVTSPIWTNATTIDLQPVMLAPGEFLTNNFLTSTQNNTYVLGYQLTDINNTPDVEFLAAYAVASPQPVFTSIKLSGTNAVITGFKGYEGFHYVVQSSANLAYPQPWVELSTNVFDVDGQFNFIIPVIPGVPQQFYQLQTQ
ncbi:MAG: hypothetical protein ABSH15_03125 [Verrucomicrobiota bacterium]|jgi:hypothetical protein